MKTSSKMLFLTMTIMSTMMVLSASNWMTLWMGMEMNLMSFIPLMYKSKNSFLSQSSMMYFLIQSMASTIFIIFMLMNMYLSINMMNKVMINITIMFTMMMKMGMPPFHMWFPEVMEKLSWDMSMMLMTWQKVAPLYIMATTMENSKLTMTIIMLSTMTGAIMGLNHTSLRKILAYSSINHMGWLMSCAMMYKKMWMMYMIMYSTLIIMLCMNFKKYNIMYINQFNVKSLTMSEKMSMLMLMLSMGGLPPFLGFLPKWITIEYMIMSSEIMLLMLMVLSSLITLLYYMRAVTYMMLMMSFSQKWTFLNKTKSMLMMTLYMNLMFPMIIMLLNFM